MTTDHFSIPDWNWGLGIPDGAIPPPDLGTDPHADEENPNCVDGSIIECQNQQLREALPIVGSPFSLTYATSRAPGRKVERAWDIVYRTEDLGNFPADFKKIIVTVEVAGQVIRNEPILDGNDTGVWPFTWDGSDVYGRRIFGGVPAVATVVYLYEAQLLGTGGGVGDGFGGYSGSRVVLYQDRSEVALVKEEHKTLYSPVPGPIAGWSLDVLHQYDPYSNILTMGDGRKRNAHSLTQTLTTIAGADPSENHGWQVGVSALESELHGVADVVATPEGGYLIAEFDAHRIREVTVDGMIELVAGTGFSGASGDDGLAIDAKVGQPTSVAVAPDETIFLCHRDNSGIAGEELRRIRRITPDDGIIHAVIDDSGCEDLAVAPDGRVYYTDAIRHNIYRLEESVSAPHGFEAVLVAGDGTAGFLGEDETVVGSRLNIPSDLAFTPDGSLFFGDIENEIVRQITTDGLIRTIAGVRDHDVVDGDGGPADQAGVGQSVEGIEVDPTGRLYIAGLVDISGGWGSVREIDPRGTIRTVAGADSGDPLLGSGGPSTAQKITNIRGLSWDPEGRLVIAEQGWNHGGGGINFSFLKRLGGLLPPYDERIEYAIPSESGDEVYFFDGLGRHEFTADALTGAVVWDFIYEPAPAFPARLIEVLDVNGRKTAIERDGAGTPTAIVGPDGQRTELLVDALGWLQAVRNPALETYKFKNTADGLLEELEPPNGLPRKMITYDTLGRFERETDREGGFQELILTPGTEDGDYRVDRTTAEGRLTLYDVEPVATGGQKRTDTSPAAVETIRTILPDGTTTIEYPEPDGPMGEKIATTVTWREGPDPRFGQIAPVIESFTVTTPGGKTASLTTERTLTLSDPDDITSLDTQTDTITFNGRESTLVYTKTDPDPMILGGDLTLTTAGGRTIETTLDEKGRVEQVQFASYAPIDYTYDPVTGRLVTVTQLDRTVSYDYYDSGPRQGFLETITDPLLQTTTFDWDAAGRVTSQTLPPVAGMPADSVGFGYDANGNLTSVTPPGRPAHLFHYTLADRVDGYQAPDAGSGPAVTQSVYNLDHQVETVTRPDGKVIDPVYEASGRLDKVTVPHGLPGNTGDYVFTYEPVTGRLSTLTDPDGGLLTYGYDGPLVTSVDWAGEVAGTVSATYTNEFWLDEQKVEVGGSEYSAIYAYDDDGLLTGAGALAVTRETQPVNTGQLESTTLGILTDSYAYDPDYGELESYSVTDGTDVLYSYTIDTRDELGRIVDKTETIEGVTKVYHYDYDARGRLTHVFVDTVLNEQYEYDANSNRTAWTLGSTTYTASYDDQDRLTTYGAGGTEDIILLYSTNGELQSKTQNGASVLYDYDVLGNLRRAFLDSTIQVEYVIDGANRRVGKKVDGTLTRGWLYQDQLNPVAELDSAGGMKWRFVYGTKSNVPDYMEDAGGARYRLITDHLGSVRLVVDELGIAVQRIDYDAFGRTLSDSNSGFQPFGFAGGLYDEQTGFLRFGARDYDPEVGRWTAKDPIGFQGGDPNLYSYSFNDPVNLLDPSGQVAPAVVIGGAALWALAEAAFSIYDIYDTASTLLDPCRSGSDKVATALGLALGLVSPGGGYGTTARTVIGKLDDIGAGSLRPGESTLLKHLVGNLGSPRANWARNASVLRREMRKGLPIRDASVDPLSGRLVNDTGFLRAERNLLRTQGWTYNPNTTLWSPPGAGR